LLNIRQTQRLQALYQADVNRGELERLSLARELHDGPLNEFARLLDTVEDGRVTEKFQPTYDLAVADLRRTITGLRPMMLNYGLATGLRSLVSELGDQWPDGAELVLEAPPAPERYPEQVETHAYRIMQQACVNALRHAGAHTIRLGGRFEPARLELTVEDDGQGFAVGADLAEWLAQHHFGLAGMHERAALIGGALHIHSTPGAGTRLRLVWPAPTDA
jgi:signal transduction histidine kinase